MNFPLPYINKILKLLVLFTVLSGFCLNGHGQTAGDYRTNNSGNWSNTGIWQSYNGTAWVAAGNYPGQAAGAGTVTLLNNVTLDVSPANAIGSLVFQASLAQSNSNNNRTLNVTGDVIISSGTLNLSGRNGYRITLNTGGSLTMTGGAISETANTYGELIFAGSGSQVFTKTGGTISNNIRFTVNSGSNLIMGTSILDGSTGDFTLNAGSTLTTAHPEGIALTGTTGSIRVTGTRNFSTGADYVYNGTAAQISGTGLPATVRNLTANNISGVTLTSSVAVTGILTLTAGSFNVGANTLTLNGPAIAGTPNNLSTSASSSLVFGGSSGGITIPSSVLNLNNLNINNGNGVTQSGNITLDGTLTLTAGALNIGANTLTLNGPAVAGTPSNLNATSSSSLVFGGSSAGISIPSSITNLLNLTVNNNSGVALTGNVEVGNTLTMTRGNLVTGSNIITLSNSAAGSLVHTAGTITGRFQRAIGSTAAEYLFPVGTSTAFSPLKIAFTSLTAGRLTVHFQPLDPGTGGLPLNDAGNEIHDRHTTGYWTMTADGTLASTNYSVRLDYSGFAAVDARARILKRTDGGSLVLDGTHGTVASPEISRTGMDGISTTATDLAIGKADLRIITQPADATGCNALFSLTVSGRAPLTYQWQENDGTGFTVITDGGIYSGTATSILAVSGAPGSMNGYSYRCVVTDGYGYSATSNSATLTVPDVYLGFINERNITIDHSRVSGGEDLFNFPVLISLTGQIFLQSSPAGQIINVNGYDIIFTDEEYNKLDHQLEYYNGTSGDLIAWVRIPTLSSSSNTVIKILYGNPQITADPSVTSVWDSHYKGVWHLDNNSLNDFTSYNKSGTSYNSPTYPAGKINNSIGLNGTNQYVEVINAPNTNFAGNITVSAWVYMNAANRDQKIAGNQNNSSGGYKFGIYTNDKVEFEIRNSANTPSLNRDVAGGTILTTGQWYYLAGISSDVLDSIKTFVNGIPERPFKKTGILGVASNTLTIGKEPWLPTYYFSGSFDEIRVSDKVRSDGWTRTEYNNQSSPSTFYTLDATGIITKNLPSAGICTAPITLTFGHPSGGVYSGNPYITGNIFSPPSDGTYAITYTYDGACGPVSVTKDFIITPVPAAPVASNKEYCTNQIANLKATSGVNIRWYDSGDNLVSTANPFSTGQSAAGTYNYTVTQTVNGCESPATAVSLTIYSGITIITQPQPVSICAGDNTSFSVAATGLNMTYQWQENGVDISNGGIYGGATTSTLSLTNPVIAMSGRTYRCVITSSCGSPVTSSTALLTINPFPVATFSFTGSPYCPNAANPLPTFIGGGTAGVFSSTPGLVFVNTATGEVDIAASIPDTYTVYNTIAAAGGCGEVIASNQIEIISTMTWTGAINTDWSNTSNWTCGIIPGASFSAQIPDIANEPVINSGITAEVRNITIENGSSLTVASGTLIIYGSVISNSGLDASDGTVEFAGLSAQSAGNSIFAGNTIKNLTVNNNSGVTLLGPLNVTGVVLVQNGTLASDGNLTLVSDAAQTALIDGSGAGTVTGNVTMQRYLPAGFGYKYSSSPFTGATVSEFGDDMDLASSFSLFYRFDENHRAAGWVSYATGTNILNPLAGYAVNFGDVTAPKTVDVTGEVNSGNISLTLFNHDSTYTKGFNLVGNPYPSPVDWDAAAGWTRPNIDDAVYYFKASDTDQYGGTYSSYVNGIPTEPGISTNIIPSMQGFFVHVSDGTYPVTGTLEVNNSARINDLTHPFLKSAKSSSRFLIRATAEFTDDTASSDPSVVYFDDFAQPAFDGRLDALKLMNTDWLVTNLYSVIAGDKKLSVNALPSQLFDTTLTVPLGLITYRDGEVRFRIRDIENLPVGVNIYFRDSFTGSVIDMLTNQEYRIVLSAGDYNNRFSIAFRKSATGIGDHPASDGIFSAYESSGKIKATVNAVSGGEGTITIYDMAGRSLYIKKVYETGYYEFDPGVSQGIYIIGYITGNQRCTLKLTLGF